MQVMQRAKPDEVDVVIVGAGLNGLYQTYCLKEKGLSVRTIEAAPDIGGVWYWNRYPGARVDSHFPFYQYFFSQDLWDEAGWQERFPAQPEIERYFHGMCDRFGLRDLITFDTRVERAEWQHGDARWLITTDKGNQISARFIVLSTGGLSNPKTPNFPGEERFAGLVCHTSRWPREGVDLAGKRVGVVGTAATGIQVIQTIAPTVGHLTVFQRTPNYAVAMRNPALTEDDLAAVRPTRADLRDRAHRSFGGFVYDDEPPLFDDLSPAERLERLEFIWADGSLRMWGGAFADGFTSPVAAAYVSEFVRGKIRARIIDPAVADGLIPIDYEFGSRRVPLERGYYETFNRDNVTLVDLRNTPVIGIDETGMVTTAGRHNLDVIIYATGFDAGVGAINAIDIRGRDGRSLREQWARSVTTTIGMQVHGFPNMFMTMAPFAPASALCNMPICAEQQVNWISEAIGFVVAGGQRAIEPSAETEQAWMQHHQEVSEPTIIGQNSNSWYRLRTADGQNRELLAYLGGIDHYRTVCDAYRNSNYAGFELA